MKFSCLKFGYKATATKSERFVASVRINRNFIESFRALKRKELMFEIP